MGKVGGYRMFDHMKPQLWTMFAAAGLAAGLKVEGAARNADDMLALFEKRFPREGERDAEA